MKTYKAFIKDIETKEKKIITIQQNTLKDAFRDIQANGFRVIGGKIKEAAKFDEILNTTNCNEWDWHPRKFKNMDDILKSTY